MHDSWVTLRPLVNDSNSGFGLLKYTFPLYVEARYIIGSMNADAVNILLPSPSLSSEEHRLPVEAILKVDEDGKVWLERPDQDNAGVSVSGEKLARGTSWRTSLEYGSTISFGPWQFIFEKSKEIFELDHLQKTVDCLSCQVCRAKQDQIMLVMECGHNICVPCREQISSQPPPRRVGLRNRGENGPRSKDLPCCFVCQRIVNTFAANSAIANPTTKEVMKTVTDISDVEARRPQCDDCENKRGFFGSRDYDFCEECKKMLCPVCTLQRHRNHKLKPRIDRLRELDEIDQKLMAIRKTLAFVMDLKEEIMADKEISQSISSGHEKLKASVSVCVEKAWHCRRFLDSLEMRKRMLARGWDEVSQVLVDEFDKTVAQIRELKESIDRMRKEGIWHRAISELEESIECYSSTEETPSSSPDAISSTST